MSIPKTHPFAFDPTYGMRLQELLAIEPPEEPEGFDAFWEARYLKALAIDPQPALSLSKLNHPDWHVLDLVYCSTGAFNIGGWLLLPREGQVRRGLVVGHGYGGRDQPDFDLPITETAVIFPCCRGLSLSSHPPISQNPSCHVLHDIDKRDAYIIGGCVEDIWLAVSTLVTIYPGSPAAPAIAASASAGASGRWRSPLTSASIADIWRFRASATSRCG